jgi:23S rRNA pseudouridine1911/1915/1917 synthase
METISRSLIVPVQLAGRRLDQAAALLLPEFSRSRLKQWIDGGELTVDGSAGAPKQRLRGGETLALQAALEPVVPVAPEAIPLAIVHANSDFIVIDKPAGLVVHPGAGNAAGTLQNALLAYDPALAAVPRAGIVHRLDKDTSGLLLIARNLTSQQRLVAMLERREIHRTYRAVCQTVLTGGGVVDAPIDRHPRDRKRMAVRAQGRPARTHYRVLARFRAHSFIELELESGRTHQIRVHMAHLRAPLVGDPVYGGRPRLPRQPDESLRVLLQSFPRQALHACRLAFPHPATAEPVSFDSALPADIQDLIAALEHDRAEHGA